MWKLYIISQKQKSKLFFLAIHTPSTLLPIKLIKSDRTQSADFLHTHNWEIN